MTDKPKYDGETLYFENRPAKVEAIFFDPDVLHIRAKIKQFGGEQITLTPDRKIWLVTYAPHRIELPPLHYLVKGNWEHEGRSGTEWFVWNETTMDVMWEEKAARDDYESGEPAPVSADLGNDRDQVVSYPAHRHTGKIRGTHPSIPPVPEEAVCRIEGCQVSPYEHVMHGTVEEVRTRHASPAEVDEAVGLYTDLRMEHDDWTMQQCREKVYEKFPRTKGAW